MSSSKSFGSDIRRMPAERMRIMNERAVLTAIALSPGSSAAELARMTGLGGQTVARILQVLESNDLITRSEPRVGQRGQPATPIHINPSGCYSVGCEVGWRHYHVMVRNMGGEVLAEHRRDYDYPTVDTLNEVGSITRLLVGKVPEAHRDRILGMGLAMPTDIWRNIGLIGASPAVAESWRGIDAAAEVERVSGLKVRLCNDGNAACWAALAAHSAPRPSNMAYLHIGEAVGAGIIADGRLWEGPTGNSANLGSMLVTDGEGRQQFVHLVSSILAFENRLSAAGQAKPIGNPADWDWAGFGTIYADWLHGASWGIAKTIANTLAILEFEIVVIDGNVPRQVLADLTGAAESTLEQLPSLGARPRIVQGGLGSTAAARGAALRPIFQRHYSREVSDINSTW